MAQDLARTSDPWLSAVKSRASKEALCWLWMTLGSGSSSRLPQCDGRRRHRCQTRHGSARVPGAAGGPHRLQRWDEACQGEEKKWPHEDDSEMDQVRNRYLPTYLPYLPRWERREGYVPPRGRAFLPCVSVVVLVLPGLGLTVVQIQYVGSCCMNITQLFSD